MGQPAAKKGDKIVAFDKHLVLVNPGPVLQLLPHPFAGTIGGGLSSNVNIMGKAAATVDSTADNSPKPTPTTPGSSFQKPPSNKATIKTGSATVKINGKRAA